MLPFWDWSSGPTTGLPSACSSSTYVNRDGATVSNPLFAGPKPDGTTTSRRSDIDTTSFDDLATDAQDALTNTGFSSFQVDLNGVHGSVHGRISGDMGSVPYAGFDPVFYMHHANVDRPLGPVAVVPLRTAGHRRVDAGARPVRGIPTDPASTSARTCSAPRPWATSTPPSAGGSSVRGSSRLFVSSSRSTGRSGPSAPSWFSRHLTCLRDRVSCGCSSTSPRRA